VNEDEALERLFALLERVVGLLEQYLIQRAASYHPSTSVTIKRQ